MTILSISTSSGTASAAVYKNGRISCLYGEPSVGGHSEIIMPLVEKLLADNDTAMEDIDVFACDIGPGSYTGVRIGVCAVNAMAFTSGKKIIGVPSLEALKYCVDGDGKSVCALLDCRNGNGYAALYSKNKTVIEPSAVVVAELIKAIPENTVFVGDGGVLHRELILANCTGATFAEGGVSAEGVIKAALARIDSGEAKADEVTPMYLRQPQAERMQNGR